MPEDATHLARREVEYWPSIRAIHICAFGALDDEVGKFYATTENMMDHRWNLFMMISILKSMPGAT
jgi:hypothetical protein